MTNAGPDGRRIEEALTGGNMEPVVRIDDTVRRVAGPWTPAVHALLDTLVRGGVPEVPSPIGIDDQGREILTYLPGTVLDDVPPETRWSDSILQQTGGLLRRMHDASTSLIGGGRHVRTWRSASHEPVEVVCHNDFAPYNLLVTADRLSGVIDFDFASPGPRIRDLAYLAYRMAPFAEDALDDSGFTAGEREARLERLIAAYGVPFESSEVLRVGADRLLELADFTDARAVETGRTDLPEHAAMYRRDAVLLVGLSSPQH
ncbi:phosphotransferase enzyme family protein [Agromyces sp. NPDC058110]|uniref:phosphotransferase enzyme family protein n=1 Tax=Agromyces sp. NPDC058110 TaxID=3346345 RepID=UPI0036DBC742